jgi:hypothetical protein
MQPDTLFVDDRGRPWQWRFMPKDFSWGECRVQMELEYIMKPYNHIFGDQVIIARDLLIVMGKDKDDYRRLSEEVTWAVQTQPWLQEVDLWPSFVDVDAAFLKGLDHKWLE